MDPCIQKVIDAATRLSDALTAQTGPVSMAVRMAHKRLREALAGLQTPEPGVRAPFQDTSDFLFQLPGLMCNQCGRTSGLAACIENGEVRIPVGWGRDPDGVFKCPGCLTPESGVYTELELTPKPTSDEEALRSLAGLRIAIKPKDGDV